MRSPSASSNANSLPPTAVCAFAVIWSSTSSRRRSEERSCSEESRRWAASSCSRTRPSSSCVRRRMKVLARASTPSSPAASTPAATGTSAGAATAPAPAKGSGGHGNPCGRAPEPVSAGAPAHFEFAPGAAAGAAHRVRNTRRRKAEQLRHRGQQPHRVFAVVVVIADAGDVGVAHARALPADRDRNQLVSPVELPVGAHDVAVHESGRPQRAQSPLQAHRDRDVQGGRADVLGHVRVLQHLLRRAPQGELGLIGEPAVLVAQAALRVRRGPPGRAGA